MTPQISALRANTLESRGIKGEAGHGRRARVLSLCDQYGCDDDTSDDQCREESEAYPTARSWGSNDGELLGDRKVGVVLVVHRRSAISLVGSSHSARERS